MSRSSVYYAPCLVSQAVNLALIRQIDCLHMNYPFAGSSTLRDLLNHQCDRGGVLVDPVDRKRHLGHTVFPYLLQEFAIARSNQVWALDTTYIPMKQDFVYLTAVID